MQENLEKLNRRAFLKLGTSGLAVAGTACLLPPLVAEEKGERRAPGRTIVLRSTSLEVTFDAADGQPFEYRLLKSKVRFKGESFGAALNVRLYRREPWGFVDIIAKPRTHRLSNHNIDFDFTAMYASNAAAVDFTLRYTVENSSIRVTLEDVREREGFELISIRMPSLVSVDEHDSDAWLAHGDAGGDMVALREANSEN